MMDESIKNKFEGGKQSNSSQNIKVVKKGESEKTIVVGAHYDSAGTHGVDDNGSGIAVALENALRMADTQTHYTIIYFFKIYGFIRNSYPIRCHFLQTPNTTLLKNNRKEMPKHLNYTFYSSCLRGLYRERGKHRGLRL